MFLALVRLGFLPQWLAERNQRYGTPHRAIAISVIVPVVVVLATRGQMALLGDMYSFGLLGAFTLTSIGIDRLRIQEKYRGPVFWLGLFTSLLVVVAWGVNLIAKTKATLFGGSVTLVGFAIAYAVRRGWIGGHRAGFTEAEAAERAAGELETATEVVTLEEALEMKAMYPSTTLVAVRAANLRLFQEALARARGAGDAGGLRHLRRRGPGPVLPAQGGPVARGARGAAGGGRLLQAGGLHGGADLAHGPRRRRVGRGRGPQARRWRR